MKEYKTTYFKIYYPDRNCEEVIDNPQPPEGEGWEMCGSAANSTYQFWYWVREVPKEES